MLRLWKLRWLRQLFAWKNKKSPYLRPIGRAPLMVELLEDRTLLSVTPSLAGLTATFTGDALSDHLQLRVTDLGVLEYSTDSVRFSTDFGSGLTFTVSAGAAINVNLGGGDDGLAIGASLHAQLLATGATVAYNGGAGVNSPTSLIETNDPANLWTLS